MNTNRYDIFQSISQREDRALSEEDARLVSVANDIIRAARNGRKDEAESGTGAVNVIDLNEIEQRTASTKCIENRRMPYANPEDAIEKF